MAVLTIVRYLLDAVVVSHRQCTDCCLM